MIVKKKEKDVSGYIFAWDGRPYKKNIFSKELTCDIPAGEPTGENTLPGVRGVAEGKCMLRVKQEYCLNKLKMLRTTNINEIKKLTENELKYLDYMSSIRKYWKERSEKRKKDLFESVTDMPGKLLQKTLIKPFLLGLTGLVVITVTGASVLLYVIRKTKTTETLGRFFL